MNETQDLANFRNKCTQCKWKLKVASLHQSHFSHSAFSWGWLKAMRACFIAALIMCMSFHPHTFGNYNSNSKQSMGTFPFYFWSLVLRESVHVTRGQWHLLLSNDHRTAPPAKKEMGHQNVPPPTCGSPSSDEGWRKSQSGIAQHHRAVF